jgi:hypothetical protein
MICFVYVIKNKFEGVLVLLLLNTIYDVRKVPQPPDIFFYGFRIWKAFMAVKLGHEKV